MNATARLGLQTSFWSKTMNIRVKKEFAVCVKGSVHLGYLGGCQCHIDDSGRPGDRPFNEVGQRLTELTHCSLSP
jgi:hypothetical protein